MDIWISVMKCLIYFIINTKSRYLFKCAKLPEHKSNSNPTDTGQWAGVIVAKLYKLKSAFGHYHKLCTVSWR